MYLKISNDIENNAFSTVVSVDSFGTEQLSADEEKELLADFPTKIAYRHLVFSRNVKINGSVPEITGDEAGDGVVAVTLPTLSNKELAVNADFTAAYKVDLSRIPAAAVDGAVLTTPELVAQAYCLVFADVICKAVEDVMTALRSKAPSFSGEKVVSV